MFTSKYFKEYESNNIEIIVPDAFVSKDIIMGFYGQQMNSGNYPKWRKILELYVCSKFFLLPFEPNLLDELKVDPEGFDLLLYVVKEIGLDSKYIKLLISNMPNEYNISLLDNDIQNKIKSLSEYNILTRSVYNINIWNYDNNNLLKQVEISKKPDNKYGRFKNRDKYKKYIKKLNDTYIAIVEKNKIIIWDLIKLQSIHELIINDSEFIINDNDYTLSKYILDVHYNKNLNQISCISFLGTIHTWNFDNGEEISMKKMDKNKLFTAKFSSDGKYIIYLNLFDLCILSLNTGKKILKFMIKNSIDIKVKKLYCSPNDKYIVCVFSNNEVEISQFVPEFGEKINSFYLPKCGYYNATCFSNDDNFFAMAKKDKKDKKKNIYIYNLTKKIKNYPYIEKILTLKGHKHEIKSIAYSSDNKQIITSDSSGMINVWDSKTGDLMSSFVISDKISDKISDAFFIKKN